MLRSASKTVDEHASCVFKTVATICIAVVGLLSFVVLIETIFGLG